jgi:hypothetical protein
MKRLTKRSRSQLALSLEREARHDLTPEQRTALLTALADLLLEALGVAPPDAAPDAAPDAGESHER